ncbi:sterol desaturase family protein, partial [Cribrihabitans sp. XS_ASV171]
SFNPLRVAFHEWVGIWRDVTQPGLSLRERLAYAFAPPGYSHDGSRLTSEQIKAAHLARHPEDAGTPGFENHDEHRAPVVAE